MKKIITLVIIAVVLIACVIWKSISYDTHHITIRSETIKSNKIDTVLNNTSIIYFSDLHFGTYTKENDLDILVETINKLNGDVVIFGGDLIDNYTGSQITQDQKQYLISKLKSINAKQDKYYVLGDHDLYSDETREEINTMLSLAGFTSLVNTNYRIYNKTNSYFNIVGLDSLLKGTPNTTEAYKDIDSSKFTLSFIHCPDLYNELPLESTDYVIAGHSHGGQIYIPLIDNIYRSKGCEKFFHGKHKKNATTLDISNGIGLTNYSIRFNSNAEIVYYKLESTN